MDRVVQKPFPNFIAGLALGMLPLVAACRSSGGGGNEPGGPAASQGQTVYARVCLHTEWRDGAYVGASTNFVGTPDVFPHGHAFRVRDYDDSPLELDDLASGKRVNITFNEKHSQMPFSTWFAEHFSDKKPTLPASLSAAERKAVTDCKAEVGQSRQALFLAWGYPPASLTPNRTGAVLTYQLKRFDKVEVQLDEKGRVTSIRD